MERGLEGKRVAVLAGDDVDARELSEPRQALEAAGAIVQIVTPHAGTVRVQGGQGESVRADCTLADCHAGDFDALLLPGGAGAQTLASDPKAVQVVREFMIADKPVGAICEGASLLLAADAVAGRTVATMPELRTEVADAGGHWVDMPVQVDERLVTSRGPADLPHFTRAIVHEFGEQIEESMVDQVVEQSFPASDPPPGPTSIGGEGAAKGRGASAERAPDRDAADGRL